MTKEPFDKPLNEWVEEDVEIPVYTPVVNEELGRVEITQGTKKVKQKTMYIPDTSRKTICKDHEYISVDIHKYLFKCIHCDWCRIAPPVTFKYDPSDKSLRYRKSGQKV